METNRIQDGTTVRIHMNLNRARRGMADCWSVTIGGKVVGYVERATIRNASPRVSDAGWRRIQASGVRKVYAGIVGEWSTTTPTTDGEPIRLNPHRARDFTHTDGTTYNGSTFAVFASGGGFTAHQ